MKKNIKVFIKEIIPIIVGILIALWINNWNENRKDKIYINKISSSLNKELIETSEDISYNLKYHKPLIDTLDFYKNTENISILDIMRKVDGFRMPTIKINSWKAISFTKIELMEYDKISSLTNIEEQKELLKTKSQNLMSFIYQNTNDTGMDKKELLKLMMLDIMSTEKTIKKQIEGVSREWL